MALIFLLEYPNAKGRYICSSDEISLIELSEFLSARYPSLQIPTTEEIFAGPGGSLAIIKASSA
ncbi:unnamed protein product [Dovyalis caffra]|uniref:Uncharacterized protein n=1 Tax=Dovyalis caffra TaxID=77055 RepID=A0AAV1S8V7_9ROSI|nr:unnamed protein product [Dovyalis caffra]